MRTLIYKSFHFETIAYHYRNIRIRRNCSGKKRLIFINQENISAGMDQITEVKGHIVQKLVQWKKWGCAHTENMLRGLPKHLIGGKEVKIAIRELIRQEWVIPLIKTGEMHYSLNPRKTKEILQFYDMYKQSHR